MKFLKALLYPENTERQLARVAAANHIVNEKIEEIHNAFNIEGERLLAEAKVILEESEIQIATLIPTAECPPQLRQ